MRILILFFIMIASSTIYPATAEQKAKTIAEFESSIFFKKQVLVSKDAWELKTGGKNNSYSFKDTENPYSSFGVELTSAHPETSILAS